MLTSSFDMLPFPPRPFVLASTLIAAVTALAACSGGDAGDLPDDSTPAPSSSATPPATATSEGDAAPVDAGADVAIDAAHGPPPPALVLDTSVIAHIVEPDGSGTDDLGHAYTDANYWNFCSAGAVTAALHSFVPSNVTSWPAGHFLEPSHAPSTVPSGGTYWASSDAASKSRAYLMYVAMQSKPPSFGEPGVESFGSYPTTGGTLVAMRDVLNWEASKHSAGWKTFFYDIAPASGTAAASLHADVVKDVVAGHGIVAAVDTGYLPNWSRSLSHAIAVVGYDDAAKTYTYVDTCGVRCNGSSKAKNGGVWTLSQTALFQGITHDGAGYVR